MSIEKPNAFISYAWVDNQPFHEHHMGWVSTFVDRLRKHLARELGRREEGERIWLDYEKLRGSDHISDAIRDQLRASYLFVPILSKGYLRSRWCQQELEIFIELYGRDSRRIFPVWMSPTDHVPPELNNLLKYKFWYEDEARKPRTRWYPGIDPADREYVRIQEDMARDMATRLVELFREERHTSSAKPGRASEAARIDSLEHDAGTLVLVNGGEDDTELIHEVKRILHQRHGLGVCVPLLLCANKGKLDSPQITRDLRDKLKLCTSVLIVCRNGPEHQIDRQIIEYLKVTAKRPKDRPPPKLTLCRLDQGRLQLGTLPAHMVEHICGPDGPADCTRAFAESLA